MAYQPGNTASASSTPANDNWKAQGFLNLYLPTPDGGRAKLGAVPLKDVNTTGVNQKKLLAGISVSDAERDRIVERIRSQIIVEYRSAEKTESVGFDLG